MEIRPSDVRRKSFTSVFRGYDSNEVDDYLDDVAEAYEQVHEENIRMREEISSIRGRLDQYEELENSIRSALVQAEKAAEDLRRSANREADETRTSASREAELTLREAKTRSHQILADSSSRVERVRESYEALKETRDTFASEFRRLLKGYLDVLESAELASAKEIEAALRDRLDTESIAVAREAAKNRQGNEKDSEDAQTTQPLHWRPVEEEPETEEPEVDPASTEQEPDTTRSVDPDAAAEVEREEPAPDGDADEGDRSSRRREQ